MPAFSLECPRCQQRVSAATPKAGAVCPACGGNLYVRYDLQALKKTAQRPGPNAVPSMYRYAAVLPDPEPLTLGEGWTPLLPSRRYPSLLVKNEAPNPTASFHAREMSVAVSVARHYGLKKLAIASAGNAASALAAYAAAAGIEAHIFMPRHAPETIVLEAKLYGAQITPVDGALPDCARILTESANSEGWLDASSLMPFRLEGAKTLGYELVEQLGWTYPDAVFFPACPGAGIIALWKAFDEMEQLGWVSGQRPKLFAVQTSGAAHAADRTSIALEIVRESGGAVIDIPGEQILASLSDIARHEGLFLCPEGAAAAAAYHQLLATRALSPNDRAVIINPASALRYIDVIADAMHLQHPATKQYPRRTPVGGIITPQ